jgi:hypothetical protein
MYYLKKTQLGVELIFYQEKSPVGQYTDPTRTRLYELEAAQRAKRTIIDIGISNQWTHMFTITLKNNRYNYELQKNKLLKHFENYKQNHLLGCLINLFAFETYFVAFFHLSHHFALTQFYFFPICHKLASQIHY